MLKFILVLGISGSGKTYWSKKWTEEDPIHRIRLNYDDIRCMFGKYWVPERESLVTNTFKAALTNAMNSGYNIVIDNMSNLNPKHQDEYNGLISIWNGGHINKYEIEYKLFDTPVEECIRRDSLRENPIGEKVIKQQWRKYRNYIVCNSVKEMLQKKAVQDESLPHCIIVDMDATVCFNTTMRPFYGDGASEGMEKDVPNIEICHLIRSYCDTMDTALIIITGRDESCKEATLNWLNKHYLNPTKLLMRKVGDCSQGDECKKQIYFENILNKYYVDFVIEDSSKVVKMYRDLGLTVLQPNEGKF